ncbi:hypothetical protein CRM22_003856 [Opisthorchis felineus]|uniref:Delta-like protein n=1 Tax=Opisthorchis felineus TaxID=147828 RepID=A0A4S2LZ45_OPIFE|nr:hypothetical protein CRM22_003856 [Opisthorchis felineus]
MWTIGLQVVLLVNYILCDPSGLASLGLSWTYDNPDSLYDSGRTCQMRAQSGCNVHFQLCLWDESRKLSKSCNLYHGTTSEYMQVVTVADTINLRISQPVPKEYGLQIKVIGRVQLDLFRPIASFEAPKFNIQANGNRTKVMLKRTQRRSKNPNVEMTASFQLTCAPHFYGSYCQNYCKPNTSHYICNSDGERICRHGLRGPLCLKKDWCVLYPCPSYAKCSLNFNEDGRICICEDSEAPYCQQFVSGCDSAHCRSWDVSTTTILPFAPTHSTHQPRTYTITTTKRPSTTARQQVIHSSPSFTTDHSSTTLASELYTNEPRMTTHQQLFYNDSASPSYQTSTTPVSELGTEGEKATVHQQVFYTDPASTTILSTEILSHELHDQNSTEVTHEVIGGFGASAQAAANSVYQSHLRSESRSGLFTSLGILLTLFALLCMYAIVRRWRRKSWLRDRKQTASVHPRNSRMHFL